MSTHNRVLDYHMVLHLELVDTYLVVVDTHLELDNLPVGLDSNLIEHSLIVAGIQAVVDSLGLHLAEMDNLSLHLDSLGLHLDSLDWYLDILDFHLDSLAELHLDNRAENNLVDVAHSLVVDLNMLHDYIIFEMSTNSEQNFLSFHELILTNNKTIAQFDQFSIHS